MVDSDSYLKWGAATLAALLAGGTRRLVVLRTPLLPSVRQVEAALSSAARGAEGGGGADPRVTTLGLPGLLALVRRLDPDVVLLACTGPVVRLLAALPPIADRRRVLVTGLPGMSLPASRRAVELRAACDLFVVHSRRERTAFAAYVGATDRPAPDLRLGLARLPFLRRPDSVPVPPAQEARDVVFAAQAKVPAALEDRTAILVALAAVPAPLRAVVKLRADDGETQTHRELLPYAPLWRRLARERGWDPDRVAFRHDAMTVALRDAAGLVTVSSTAALEAMALDLPVLVLSDFGVSDTQLNLAYADSGCLGTLDDVRAGRFRRADPAWLADNYLHPSVEDDWTDRLAELVEQRRRTPGPARRRPPTVRLALDLARVLMPPAVVPVLRRARRRLSGRGRR